MSEEFDDKLESCEGKGELTEVLKMAMSTSDCDQAEAALDACLRLTSPRGEGVEGGSAVEAVVAAHLSTVCDIVNKFQEECAVVEVGLACVKNICTKGTNFAPTNDSALLAAANLIPTMMMKYGDQQEATLMEQGCLAAQAVVKSDYLANALLDGGIRAALDAASDSIENERNKSYPEKTLKAIEVVLAGE